MHCTSIYAALLLVSLCAQASAAVINIEPDDYADSTQLTNIVPGITLNTTLSDNEPVPLFYVTAIDDNMDFAPTGIRVFAHFDIPFFNTNRRLRMDFANPATMVSIAFAGGTFFNTEVGQLDLYDANNVLLDQYLTQPLGPGEVETMSLSRPQGDIAYAIAFSQGSFGRLDALSVNVVPEPGSIILAGLGLVALVALRKKSRRANA